MPKFALIVLTACLAAVPATVAQTPTPKPGQTPPPRQTPTPTATPKTGSQGMGEPAAPSTAFLKSAAQGGMAEVELAKLATSKASRDDVKALAQTIQQDHEKANAELKDLASSKKLTLPDSVSAQQKATVDRLGKLTGVAFDKAYVDDMVKDHQKDIAEFKKHEKDSDPDVSAFVTKTLPTLQDHLAKAEAVQKAIRSTGR